MKQPIYITFTFHWDSAGPLQSDEPRPCSLDMKRMTEFLDTHGIRAHYGVVGIVAQQLAEDFPDVIGQMRKMKIPVGYHPGAGHGRAPVGQPAESRGRPPGEALSQLWLFETRALYPADHPKAGQSMPDRTGGWLALQEAFGITPLQTDAGGHGPLYEALGAGYEMSVGEVGAYLGDTLSRGEAGAKRANLLPGLHEVHVYGPQGRIPPTYYGKRPGEDAPVNVEIQEWFRILADNLPRREAFQTGFMSHSRIDWERYEDLVEFLLSRPADFRIIAPDPEGWQWEARNSPLAFYKERYGVDSLPEMMTVECPVDEIVAETRRRGARREPSTETPAERPEARIASRADSLSRAAILQIADSILTQWPTFTHDGDFGGPPACARADGKDICLADAFEALSRSIAAFRASGALPDAVPLRRLQGPIDWPRFELKAAPQHHPERLPGGYYPHDVPRAAMPEPTIVNAQGLPPCGDRFIWMPTHVKVDAEDMMSAAAAVADGLSTRVPGRIDVTLLCSGGPGRPARKLAVALNPAEFLYGLAQEFRALHERGAPNDVVLVSMKLTPGQTCRLILPDGGERFDTFIWRKALTDEEINAAWTDGERKEEP